MFLNQSLGQVFHHLILSYGIAQREKLLMLMLFKNLPLKGVRKGVLPRHLTLIPAPMEVRQTVTFPAKTYPDA